MTTKIEWADETWNVASGCDHCSEGCDHCYIERTPPLRISRRRFDANGRMGVELHPERFDVPVRRRKPTRYFVNSISDTFHPAIPDGYIAWLWWAMWHSPHHQFLILTKRPQRMADWTNRWEDRSGDLDVRPDGLPPLPRGPDAIRATYRSPRAHLFAAMLDQWGPPPDGAAYPLYDWMEGPRFWLGPQFNAGLGASIELDKYSFRADHVRRAQAALRWISAEPLLGPLPSLDLNGIDWLVIGGESGPGARPMRLEWAEDLVERCRAAGVRVFVKQLGAVYGPDPKGSVMSTWPASLQIREQPW